MSTHVLGVDGWVQGIGGRSHIFRLRLWFCSKISEPGSRSGTFSNLRIRLLFKLRQSSTMT